MRAPGAGKIDLEDIASSQVVANLGHAGQEALRIVLAALPHARQRRGDRLDARPDGGTSGIRNGTTAIPDTARQGQDISGDRVQQVGALGFGDGHGLTAQAIDQHRRRAAQGQCLRHRIGRCRQPQTWLDLGRQFIPEEQRPAAPERPAGGSRRVLAERTGGAIERRQERPGDRSAVEITQLTGGIPLETLAFGTQQHVPAGTTTGGRAFEQHRVALGIGPMQCQQIDSGRQRPGRDPGGRRRGDGNQTALNTREELVPPNPKPFEMATRRRLSRALLAT